MTKKKNEIYKKELFLFIFLSFILSFLLVVSAFLFKKLENGNKINKKTESLTTNGEHFSKTKLDNFFINLTKKYPFLTNKSRIEDCNKINITKERILCKEYFKQKQRDVLIYKPYLVFALVKYGVLSANEAINKYKIPKEKLAEALDNSSYCFNDEKCLKEYERFKKNYKDTTPIKDNIEKAWQYYKQGLLSLKNYENPYRLNCTSKNSCKAVVIKN